MRTHVLLSSALPLLLVGCLQAQVNTPKVGLARYSDNSIHAVFGLHDDFVLSSQVIGSADTVSFSNTGGLIATGGHIQLIGTSSTVLAEYDSDESTPLLNIDGELSSAIAWLPTHSALLHWNGNSFVLTELRENPPGRVTSVRLANPGVAKLLVTEPAAVVSEMTISVESGSIIAMRVLPGIGGPAFAHRTFVLFPTAEGLGVESDGGLVRTLPIFASDLVIERMSSDWLHLSSASAKQHWVLHLNERTLELSEFPVIASAVRGRDK